MREGKLKNCYIPKNRKTDNAVVKLLNFIISGQYLIIAIVFLCAIYELVRALLIGIFAEATASALTNFAIIKLAYLFAYVGFVYMVLFTLKLSILGVFKFRNSNSITFERRGWLIVSAIASMLLGTILSLLSSEMLVEVKQLSLDAESLNSNQTWMIIFVLSVCYIYVLGKVQEFRDALKESGLW